MKTIKIYTNLIYGGIDPHQYETGVGGSEEKLFEFAKYFANRKTEKGEHLYDVTVYTNGWHGDFEKVHYKDHREYKSWEPHDIFISFKNKEILLNSINASKVLHFTTEIEPRWPNYLLDQVDQIITISNYHTHRMGSSDEGKVQHEYLWFDAERANANIVDKEPGTMLYCSSYDRGLEELLVNWDKVKEKMGLKKLYITYGWDFLNQLIKTNPNMKVWKDMMESLLGKNMKKIHCNHCGQDYNEEVYLKDDIVMLGRQTYDQMCELYWKAEYWCLPLNKPDAELFCINAIKAQYAGAIPIVRRTGALQETVNNFVAWEDVAQHDTFIPLTSKQILENKKFAADFSLTKRLKSFEKLLNS